MPQGPRYHAPYSPDDLACFFAELNELGQEYVINARWASYEQLLANAQEAHADTSTLEELEELTALISHATKGFLVDRNWKAYRKFLMRVADLFGLDHDKI